MTVFAPIPLAGALFGLLTAPFPGSGAPLGVPESTPPAAVRVVPAAPAWEAAARTLAGEAPAIVERVARRLDLPPPPEMLIVVTGDPPRTPREERDLGVRDVPPWAAGIAEAATGRILLFVREASVYPHRDVTGLIAHEATHVLLEYNTRGARPIPRWFHEGLAMSVERDLSLSDALRLAWSFTWRRPVPLAFMTEGWPAREAEARAAYAQALSMVTLAERDAPPGAVRRLVLGLREGLPFEPAFRRAYGVDPETLAAVWYREARWRYLLRPALWAAFSFNGLLGTVALVAAIVGRVRRRRRMAEWDEQERRETLDYGTMEPPVPPA